MTDGAIQVALQKMRELTEQVASERNRIADAQARVAKMQDEQADLERWIIRWHDLSGVPMAPPTAERIANTRDTGPAKRPKNPDREFVADRAVEIIRELGEPMSRAALFEALVSEGVVIRGKDPEMVLSTMLWRSKDKIVRLPNHGYWPADEDHEDAAYFVQNGVDIFGMAANEPEGGIEADDAE